MKKAVVALVFDKDSNKVFATHRKDNLTDYGLIGGKVEESEDSIDAIIREMIEETGHMCNLYYRCTLPDNEYTVDCYIGDVKTLKLVEIDNEGLGVWVDLDDIKKGTFGEFNIGFLKLLGL